jgi:hypothetical protein
VVTRRGQAARGGEFSIIKNLIPKNTGGVTPKSVGFGGHATFLTSPTAYFMNLFAFYELKNKCIKSLGVFYAFI